MLDENPNVIVQVSSGTDLGVIDVLCSAMCLAAASDAFANVLASQTGRKIQSINLARDPPLPPKAVLFILQLIHSNGIVFPHRPSHHEELIEIMDMAVMLGCLVPLYFWLRSFQNPRTGISKIPGIQGAAITVQMGINLDIGDEELFAETTAEFIKRSSQASLRKFRSTYFGKSLNDAMYSKFSTPRSSSL
jgi:hypothetical protein